jgi:hypothetical protein
LDRDHNAARNIFAAGHCRILSQSVEDHQPQRATAASVHGGSRR